MNGNLSGQLQDAAHTWHLQAWGRFSVSVCKLLFQIKTEWWNNPIIERYHRTHICSVLPLFSSHRNVPKAFLLKCGMPTGRSTSPFQQNIRCVQTCSGGIPFLFTFSKICRIWLEDTVYATADTSAGCQPVQLLGALAGPEGNTGPDQTRIFWSERMLGEFHDTDFRVVCKKKKRLLLQLKTSLEQLEFTHLPLVRF